MSPRLVSSTVVCLLLLSASFRLAAQERTPDFRVSIFAITQFDDPKLSGPDDRDLNEANADAARTLYVYFHDTRKVLATSLYIVPQETSHDFLVGWLAHDLKHDSRNGVHLVFVLTHGFPDPGPDPRANKGEIYLATSNTYRDVIPGQTVRGSEFIDTFRDMLSRASVFLFLDTCGSGALDSNNLRHLLQHEPELASRIMILAAASADELAYRARFTNALLDLWKSQAPSRLCGQSEIEKFLTDALKQVPGVSPDVKQSVRVVAPLSPDFCIDSFNQTKKLLMVYNAADVDITVTVVAADTGEPGPEIPVKAQGMAPISELRATHYTLVAKRMGVADESASITQRIDLTSVPAKVVPLFSSDPLDVADASQAAAQYLDSRRILPAFSAELIESSNQTSSMASSELGAQLEMLRAEQAALNDAVSVAADNLERKRNVVNLNQKELESAKAPFVVMAATQSDVERTEANLKITKELLDEYQAKINATQTAAAEAKISATQAAAEIGVLKMDVEQTKSLLKKEQSEHEAAVTKMKQDYSAAQEREVTDTFEHANAKFQLAQSEYEISKEQARQLKLKKGQLQDSQAHVLAKINHLPQLRKAANDLADQRASMIQLETSAGSDLKRFLNNVQQNERGIMATLTGNNVEGAVKTDRLGQFVGISNKYPQLDVEIELWKSSQVSPENQYAIRQEAAGLLKKMRDMGLKTKNAVARGFISDQTPPVTINLILSHPR